MKTFLVGVTILAVICLGGLVAGILLEVPAASLEPLYKVLGGLAAVTVAALFFAMMSEAL